MGLDNPVHLAIIALVIVLLFGAKRLPELGRSLGSGIREFKGSLTGENDDDDQQAKPPVVEASSTPAAEAPATPAAATPESASAPSVGVEG